MAAIRVEHPCTLIEFLLVHQPGSKRATAKRQLGGGHILVNGVVTNKATTALHPGDQIEIQREGQRRSSSKGPKIIHVDPQLVVINKPSGLLSVSGGGQHRGQGRGKQESTVLSLVGPQLKGDARLFPCHRLDRETSGLLLLPRTKEIQAWFFENWEQVEKRYLLVVEGVIDNDEGTINAPLFEDERSLAVSVSEAAQAREAVTDFKVLARSSRCSLVEARLQTGRKHQIRVHLQHLGHPVLGDRRYGTAAGRATRLCLHAAHLSFPHPITDEEMTFDCPAPSFFKALLKD